MIKKELLQDQDIIETEEWFDALDSVIKRDGVERANYLLQQLHSKAIQLGCKSCTLHTPYNNTIKLGDEAHFPGDLTIEKRIRAMVRWNAVAMVTRGYNEDPSLGGHIGTSASTITIYDVGFNHFFRGSSKDYIGDIIFTQGHASPAIYSRAYVEGRLTEEQLAHFRRGSAGKGLCSYPHPWHMPEFWQFPTVSMGLGPLQAVYQARLSRYMAARGIADIGKRRVWCFCGDGEMAEPESISALSLAARENLDNLIFVVNCNLQSLDGPVRGNGKIIQELEAIYRGAGWHVIKAIWGKNWDPLFKQDKNGILQLRLEEMVDGEFQACKAHGAAYTRKNLFGAYPELQRMVADLSDESISNLKFAGHDPTKLYAAYNAAIKHEGQPTVILAKTVKGYGLHGVAEALNVAHNVKHLTLEQLKEFRDRFEIPISNNKLEEVPFYRASDDSIEMRYLKEKREALGGHIPSRRRKSDNTLKVPALSTFTAQLKSSGERNISTTMAFIRILMALTKDANIGKYIVPILSDEARTFGMEGMFRQLGIYYPMGQKYTPEDSNQVMCYKEAKDGQIMQEGLNEAGAISAWLAAATSYSVNNRIMIPFFIFYSMFGFQRIGDMIWAAADSRARGFLIGGTSGRTTLNGEGLQHADGHSHIAAATIPNCISYDATFSYEVAVIVQDGLRRMVEEQEDVFYYLTTLNENYIHPNMPAGAESGILKGLYLFNSPEKKYKLHVQLIGSGAILREIIAAQELLEKDFNISADVWAATSFNLLARDGIDVTRWNRFHPKEKQKIPYITQCLQDLKGPVIAATDYIRQYAEQVRQFIPATYASLGTDGFGRSDTRETLRDFFEVNRYYIVVATLDTLMQENKITNDEVIKAIKLYKLDPNKPNPSTM
jgi:pyruvate dehydrogenase E1 component